LGVACANLTNVLLAQATEGGATKWPWFFALRFSTNPPGEAH
jgi:hypothetical protein